MRATKVLVIDDSRMMRVLISSALEQIPNIEVVGEADGADQAREKVAALRPDVLTLDVEMPGMSGLAYLEEVMSTRPLPVIMFSTRTSEGASDTAEALRLGAIGCFPKPVAAPNVMQETIANLARCIKQATDKPLTKLVKDSDNAPIDWNGRPVFIGADAADIETLCAVFATYPSNCPPTVALVRQMTAEAQDELIATLAQQTDCEVVLAADGMAIAQGTIYFAPQGDSHLVVDGWPEGRLRLLARDPVAGHRPSMSLLFASAAKAVGREAVGLVTTGDGEDAVRSVGVMRDGKGYVIASEDGGGFELSRGMAAQPVTRDGLPGEIMKLCRK